MWKNLLGLYKFPIVNNALSFCLSYISTNLCIMEMIEDIRQKHDLRLMDKHPYTVGIIKHRYT